MTRLVQTAQRLAGLLLVCAVVFAGARASVLGDHSWLPVALAFGLIAYLGWKAWRVVRRLIPKRSPRAAQPPALPSRAHWLSPRTLQRRGRP
jgi:hypothetical protein